MGKELEYKLAIPKTVDAAAILRDPKLSALQCSDAQQRHMKTTYYDSPDRRFSKQHWTLRHRMEGEESVVTVKTPTEDFHTRGEWQIHAPTLDDSAIEQLLLAGAPKQLLVLYGLGDIRPICAADFIRTSMMLSFSDGSQAEFAYDRGSLSGETEQSEISEAELELYSGEPKKMLEFVQYLCQTYGLSEEPRSKFSRASALK